MGGKALKAADALFSRRTSSGIDRQETKSRGKSSDGSGRKDGQAEESEKCLSRNFASGVAFCTQIAVVRIRGQ